MKGESFLFAIVIVGVALLAALGIRAEHRRYVRCHDVGGQMKHVRCRIVEDQNCITTDYGQGMVITSCSPSISKSCETACLLDDGQEISP